MPESLGNLTALTELELGWNHLTALPLRLADVLDGEIALGLWGNPLPDPLPELAEQGPAAVATYLRSRHAGEP